MIPDTDYDVIRQKTQAVATTLKHLSQLVGARDAQVVSNQDGELMMAGLGNLTDASQLTIAARDIEQGIFNVIVLGEFSSGKSTLLNALLGDATLPARHLPTTAIITIILYGDNGKIAIYEEGSSQPRYLSSTEFTEEFQLTKQDVQKINDKKYINRFNHVQYAQIESLHKLCENGVRLIDSPGLAENVSRTKVVTSYLKESHAVIMLLNAKNILSERERNFISEYLSTGRLNNIYFLVNFINETNEDDIEDLQEWVQYSLQDLFVDDHDEFDEALYNQRVFYVNVKGALDARLAPLPDLAALEASGILPFEQSLERFLTGLDRAEAVLHKAETLALEAASAAWRKIAKTKNSLNQPLATLEDNRAEIEARLESLAKKKQNVGDIVLYHGNRVKQQVYHSLVTYVEGLVETWPEDSQKIEFEKITVLLIVKSAASKKGKADLVKIIETEIQTYIEDKLSQWADTIPEIVSDEITIMQQKLEMEIEAFQLELDRIGAILAGNNLNEAVVLVDKNRSTKLLQIMLGLVAGLDVSQVTGTMMGAGDWTSFFERLGQQIALAIVVGAISFMIGGVLGVLIAGIIGIIFEGVHILNQLDTFKRRLREELSPKIHETMQDEVAKSRDDIQKHIIQRFEQISEQMTAVLEQQIAEARGDLENVIRIKQQKDDHVAQEVTRLEAIGSQVLETVNQITVQTQERPLTTAEQDQLRVGQEITIAKEQNSNGTKKSSANQPENR